MRRFSANYIYTVSGKPIRNGIVGIDDEGTVVELIDPQDDIVELAGTEFHNGIIVPGFVNAHCHTELSYMKGRLTPNTGLAGFVDQIRKIREEDEIVESLSVRNALDELHREGIVAVADICNSYLSFGPKLVSPIRFVNFVELFGLLPEKAENIIEYAREVKALAELKLQDTIAITPHAPYSLSQNLWEIVAREIELNSIASIHFAESRQEFEFSTSRSGPLAQYYSRYGLPVDAGPKGHPVEIVKRYLPKKSTILFIHNTFLTSQQAEELANHFTVAVFVLCPASNLFIENSLPDIQMLRKMGVTMAIGTDSLASAPSLSMLHQMKIIGQRFPDIPFDEILRWATLNGADALGFSEDFGSIEPGKKPGLNLITTFDFNHSKLLPASKIKRLA